MTEKVEHKPLTLVLEIDGKEKRYASPSKIKGTLWREASMIAEDIEDGVVQIIDLDSYLQFICDVYGNQFDIAELEEGLDARDMLKTIYAVTIFVMGQVSIASEMLTANVDFAEIDEKKR